MKDKDKIIGAIYAHVDDAETVMAITENILAIQEAATQAKGGSGEKVVCPNCKSTNIFNHHGGLNVCMQCDEEFDSTPPVTPQDDEREELDKGWEELRGAGLDKPFIAPTPSTHSEMGEINPDIKSWFAHAWYEGSGNAVNRDDTDFSDWWKSNEIRIKSLLTPTKPVEISEEEIQMVTEMIHQHEYGSWSEDEALAKAILTKLNQTKPNEI